jgi:hypothetical protein
VRHHVLQIMIDQNYYTDCTAEDCTPDHTLVFFASDTPTAGSQNVVIFRAHATDTMWGSKRGIAADVMLEAKRIDDGIISFDAIPARSIYYAYTNPPHHAGGKTSYARFHHMEMAGELCSGLFVD